MAAPAPAPAVRRSLLLALVLVVGLGLGAALSSALLAPSHPSVAAAGSSSATHDVPRPGAAARLQPTPAKDLDLLAAPLHRRILLAPARRRLLAYPAEFLEAHGAGVPAGAAAPAAPPEEADAGGEAPLPTRAASTGASASEISSSADESLKTTAESTGPGHGRQSLSASRPKPGAAALHQLHNPAAPPGPLEADDPAAARAPAAPPAGADEGRKVGATTCSFITYVGGAARGAVETVQRGDGRVFVVREFTGGATNGSRVFEPPSFNDEATDSDEEDDSDEEEEHTFGHYMAKFCAFVAYVRDSYDVVEAF